MSSFNADLRARLAEVNASIAELHLRLKPLEDARKQLQSELDGIVYPVATLPPEITSNIFLRCLPPSPELSSPVKAHPSMFTAPLLFLQVCRMWRNIALSTPRLWVDLHVNLGEFPHEMDEDDLEKCIRDWFGRAGTCPLSFSVRGYMSMDAFGSDAIGAIIRHHAPQLQTICLQLRTAHFEAIEDFTGPFPILEKLAVALPFLDGECPAISQLFSDAPRLSQVSFSENAIPSMFYPSHDTLVKVACESCPADDFLWAVKSHPILAEIACSVEPDPMFVYSHIDVITGSHLHTLHFMPGCSLHILPALRLPALRHLRLSVDIDENNFLAFLAHSSTSLRSFSAESEITTFTVDWFAVMPELTQLELYQQGDYFFLDFFAMLNRAQNPRFLPHLRSLTFRSSTFRSTPLNFKV